MLGLGGFDSINENEKQAGLMNKIRRSRTIALGGKWDEKLKNLRLELADASLKI